MSYTIEVENIKCGGCANTIKTKLEALDAVNLANVDIENGRVTIDGNESQRNIIVEKLLKLGYPENGTAEGISAAKAKAKSFVSCAVGRMSN